MLRNSKYKVGNRYINFNKEKLEIISINPPIAHQWPITVTFLILNGPRKNRMYKVGLSFMNRFRFDEKATSLFSDGGGVPG